jgi:hypothetical protein
MHINFKYLHAHLHYVSIQLAGRDLGIFLKRVRERGKRLCDARG